MFTFTQALFRCSAWVAVALLLAVGAPAHAQRVALLVGNANYQVGRLTNPPNDVAAMEGALKAVGFKVQKVLNANQNQMKRAVRDFGTAAQGAEVAFVYYSGHGTQANGENYLLPVGASIEKESDYEVEAVSANAVLRQIQGARPKAAILVLDACRDNPLAATTRSSTKGLGRMDAPTGTMIAFATSPNTVASDNGDYARVLAKELQKPGQELVDVFRNTTAEVRKLSGGKQEPRISEMSITERLYLAGGQGTQVASLGVEGTGRPIQADPEQEAWDLAKRRDTVAGYEGFLASFPNGRLAASARSALAGLKPAQPAVQNTQTSSSSNASASTAPTTPSQVFKDCQKAHCPEMVVIPAGSFTMGSNDGDADERPPHSVNVRSFALGKYEVTQGQWKAVMGSNPSKYSNCGDNCPVERVSWDDAQQFIQKLNQMTGKQYKLPSEAEWEYAARAGSTGKWSFGDNENALGQYAWYSANSNGQTHPVGQKQTNAFGLYDMHGNVWEWVQDVGHDNYNGAPTDGSAWTTGGDQTRRVLRGGSWISYPNNLRSAVRVGNSPDYRLNDFGFRLARTVP